MQYEFSSGFELNAGYLHDVLDRIGGGQANAGVSRGIPVGPVTFTPQLSVNWLSNTISNYDFGVPASAATIERPAYKTGSTTSYELGLGAVIELSDNWQLLMDVGIEQLDSKVVGSPIVSDREVIKGFVAISCVF